MTGERPGYPHQADFIEKFFSSKTRAHVLRADPGVGASFTAANLIHKFLLTNSASRVLMLAPKPLQKQLEHILSELGTSVDAVDRPRFRELQDAAHGRAEQIWATGRAFVLGLEFLRQSDITDSVASVPWSLIVVVEAHQLRGLRAASLERVVESSPGVRLIMMTISTDDAISTFGLEPITNTHWRRAELVDRQGQRLFTPILLQSVDYSLSPEEHQAYGGLIDLIRTVESDPRVKSLLQVGLLRAMNSSPAAVESRLRALQSRVLAALEPLEEGLEDEGVDDAHEAPVIPDDGGFGQTLLGCIEGLEALATDSKLNALNELLGTSDRDFSSAPICLCSEYKSTLFYLEADLSERGHEAYILHGGLDVETREQTFREFHQSGGIMLTTNAVLTQGVDLPFVDTVVLYDIPQSAGRLGRVLGRFQRFGRRTPLTVVALNSSDQPRFQLSAKLMELPDLVAILNAS